MKNYFNFNAFPFLFFATWALPFVSFSQAGLLDNTFDGDGKVTTAFGTTAAHINAIGIQNDGRIVVAGEAHSFTDFPFALARYNTNGSLDSTFDTDGKVTTNFGLACQANSMAIQADNKILVAGSSNNGNKNDFALVRYNTNGSLDTSFDDDGIVTTQIGLYDDVGSSVALQTDGKILVSGYTYDSVYCNFALVRYNINGSLDTSFGTDGIVLTTISSYNDFCNSLTIQGDGKIILAGSSDNGNAYDIALARYNTNGSLDTTFEGDGIVTTSIDTTSAFGSAIGIQSDGKIVVSGGHHNGTYSDFALVRYNNNGSIDSTFDSDGIVVTDFGNFAQIKSLVLQTDDKIVVAGYSYVSPNFYFAIARYNINGSLDTSFDSDGIVTTDFGTINNVARAVAIQSDGKILAGGNTNPLIFAIARYNVCIPVLSSQSFTICSGQSVTVGINNYTVSGIFIDTLISYSNGCDSIVTTNLNVYPLTTFTQSFTICVGQTITIGNNTYSVSGTYIDTLSQISNCDSIVTTNIMVTPMPLITTTVNGIIIIANQTAATYQWIDCINNNMPIANATNQTYTPIVNGSYAVAVSFGNCVDTSACVMISTVGVSPMPNKEAQISILPNPFTTTTTLQTNINLNDATVIFYNLFAQAVKKVNNITGNSISIKRDNLPSGFYFVQLIQDNKIIVTSKIVIAD